MKPLAAIFDGPTQIYFGVGGMAKKFLYVNFLVLDANGKTVSLHFPINK
jgi:hypothetical protein